MSLFLGKIHYWLFNKVLWFEGLEDKVIEFSKAKIADVDNLENQKFEDSLDLILFLEC